MLPESVTKLIGQAGDVVVMEVEKGAIKRLAHAVADDNPLHLDEEYGRNSRYGAIIAQPGFFGWPTKWSGQNPAFGDLMNLLVETLKAAGFPRLLDGGIEYDFFIPIRAGDVLAALPRVTRITEREAKGGNLIFSIIEMTYTNQAGEVVAKARQTLITR